MRQIKFRVYDKLKGTMFVDGGCMDVSQTQGVDRWVFGIDLFNHPDDVEIMQYTGLKDKNGVEIYEGDILQCEPFGETPLVAPVEYITEKGFFAFMWDSPLAIGNIGQTKVIGNIYENPDLNITKEDIK
jgi:uncharacterized phage protein (TIGR01671 family)